MRLVPTVECIVGGRGVGVGSATLVLASDLSFVSVLIALRHAY